MSNMYRWGIVGPGGIAHKFADALNHIENAKLQAVASTNAQRAKDFARKYSAANYYDSYEQLFLDDTVGAWRNAIFSMNCAAITNSVAQVIGLWAGCVMGWLSG